MDLVRPHDSIPKMVKNTRPHPNALSVAAPDLGPYYINFTTLSCPCNLVGLDAS